MTTSSEATTAAPAVAVLGSANADLVVEVDRRPAGGETIIGSDLQQFAGGKGANQSAACAKAGSSTLFVGCVGEDSNGEFLVRSLEQAGVDVSSVNRIAKPSGTAIIFLTPDGENSIVVSPGANAAFDVEIAKATQPVWSRADAVVMNFELPMATVNYVAAAAATHNQRVILNAAPAFSVDEATLRVCDPLVVNEHEAEVVLGEKLDNYERVAQALRGKGARSVVITLGGDGAVAADEDGVFRIPAYEVDVVDTTGAGDAFVGALASELSAGTTLRGAMEFATAMSAIAVQKHGAQPSYVTRNVVEAFISENQTRSQ